MLWLSAAHIYGPELVVTGWRRWPLLVQVTPALTGVQILSLDLMKQGLELPRVGNPVTLSAPLLSLSWGSLGIATRVSKVCTISRLGLQQLCKPHNIHCLPSISTCQIQHVPQL